MNATEKLLDTIGEAEFKTAVYEVIVRKGVLHLGEDVAYIGLPVCPEMTSLPEKALELREKALVVICLAGDMECITEHFCGFERGGFTHFVWKRGYKTGTKEWKCESLRRLRKRLNIQYGRRS